jgi:hypothetical protein
MKAYTPQDFPGGLCTTLAQKNKTGKIQIISHASRQLKENEKNYTKFLLETAVAAWGMDNFNEYLNGSKFILYKDAITETGLGTTQVKTLNQLKTTLSEHEFEIRDKQKSDLPDFLKKGQRDTTQVRASQPVTFNKTVHVDTIGTNNKPENAIITITDDSNTFSISAVITDSSPTSTITALWNYWFKPYRYLETISFKQGKVQTSRLEKMINDLAPLKQRVTCKSKGDTFNTELEQQWQQNQHEISEEEFVHTINFLCRLQEPKTREHLSNTTGGVDKIYENPPETNDDSENEDEPESNFGYLDHLSDEQPTYPMKRKSVSLCRHKLQGRTGYRSRSWRQPTRQHGQSWPTESKPNQQIEIDLMDEDADTEWTKLREMEKFLKLQRMELWQQGASDSDDEDWDNPQWPDERQDCPDEEEDDSLENTDLAFITSVLESFSRPKSKATKPNESFYPTFTPEGAPMQAEAKQVTPPKFNQNSTRKNSAAEKFSCFPTLEEEGADEFTDTKDTESEINREKTEFENHLQGICSITENKRNPFAAWGPFIPQEPVFQNSPAQPWWLASSPPECSSLEPTLTIISAIDHSTLKEAIEPIPLRVSTLQKTTKGHKLLSTFGRYASQQPNATGTAGTSTGQN